MKTDIQIAQEAKMIPITKVAEKAGIAPDDLELYGKYKAKLSYELMDKVKDHANGKLVLVTATNPTPAGEGKTTVTVGLGQALCRLGENAMIALREPSHGHVWELKVALQVVAMHKLFQWKILICTLQGIFMPLVLRIIY